MRMILFGLILAAGVCGFWTGMRPAPKEETAPFSVHPERNFPIVEYKSFAIVLYAYNEELWIERSLRSILEQDYDHYRVVLVDDGSSDKTFEKAKEFIVENRQENRVVVIRNDAHLGTAASLFRACETLLDREIAIPLDGKDWFAHTMVLSRLNGIYQNPDVWISFGKSIEYPSYQIIPERQFSSFYSALFKQLRLEDLFREGRFTHSYLDPLIELAGGRVREDPGPLLFANRAAPIKREGIPIARIPYPPLAEFPKPQIAPKRADILLFSYNRPLQLYACLESIYRYITGFENISVLYRFDDDGYSAGYDTVKEAFPNVRFFAQADDPRRDFKPNVVKIVFDSPSEYILFGVDDIVVKDYADLNLCMSALEKTKAYGFYLRFGKHITECYMNKEPQEVPSSVPLGNGIFAWDLLSSDADWGFPNTLDMTLYRKKDLKLPFTEMKYKTPNSLEFIWTNEYAPEVAVGLYFEQSKIVNLPFNILGKTGNPHMNSFTTEELLQKFNQGLKFDIEPLFQIENRSPHMEYVPEFVYRN